MATISVYPNKSHDRAVPFADLVAGIGTRPRFAGWICKHAAPQAAQQEGQVILCESCAAAARAGSQIVKRDRATARPSKGSNTKRVVGKSLRIRGAHKNQVRKKIAKKPARKRGGAKR